MSSAVTVTFIWLGATVAHFLLTGRAADRLGHADDTLDDRIYAAVIGGIASLSIVVHATAVTVGLGLTSGLVALGLWHAVLWRVASSGQRSAASTPFMSRTTVTDRLALTVWLGIVISWVGAAAASANILGPDNAHYHVPYALNLAHGDSPFDLPATPHLYPMAGSAIAAWFIVPLGTPLIVDLAMVLPFALLLGSLNLMFRAMTGLSGLGWATWIGLALFSTPMFRSSAAGSADLWFAAGCTSVLATVIAAWARGTWRRLDLWLLGAAVGLLLGSKTTGVAAAVLLLVGWGVVETARRIFNAPRVTAAFGAGSVAMMVLLAVGAGGLWLLRNWIQFGSPLAPTGLHLFGLTIFDGETHQRTTYYSVLGEMQLGTFELRTRAAHFVRQWFGPAYLPALVPIVAIVIDLAIGAMRRTIDQRWWTRAGGLVVTVGLCGSLIWLLIGAPWTALERSGGLTLRYLLPIAAVMPVLAATGLFPSAWPWFLRWPAARHLTAGIGVLVSVWVFWRSLESPADSPGGLPPLGVWALAAAGAGVFALSKTWPDQTGRRVRMGLGLIVIVAVVFAVVTVQRRAGESRREAQLAMAAEESAFAAGGSPASEWRMLFLTVLTAERARGMACAARRFFSLTRNDEPLALQPPEFSSRVYYAGREVTAARLAGPIGRCDYVVTTPALTETEKGRQLVDALGGGAVVLPFATTRSFIVLVAGAGRQ